MYFFIVQAVDQKGTVQLEVDLPVSQFQPLLEAIAQVLRSQAIFVSDEPLLLRLVPYAMPIKELTVGKLAVFPAALGEAYFQVYTSEATTKPGELVQSLTFWICAPNQQQVYAVQLPINWLYHSVFVHFQEQLHSAVVEGREVTWTLAVRLAPESSLRPVQVQHMELPVRSLILVLTGSSPMANSDETDLPPGDATSEAIDITERTSLVDIAEKAWESYEPSLQGVRQRGDLRVLFRHSEWESLQRLATTMVERNREAVGLLLGNHYQTDKAELFVDIQKAWLVELASRLFLSATSDVKQWQTALATAQATFPNLRVIGWYHVQPPTVWRRVLVTATKPTEQPTATVTSAHPYMPATDQSLHQKLFAKPWQVALIVKPAEKSYVFYQWKRGQLVACEGYYLYGPATETGANE